MQLDQALELAKDDKQRAVAQLALARLDQTEARHESALERLDVLEGLLGPNDAELRSEALGWRSRICWLTGRWDEALSSSNAAVAALAGLPESPQLARALARRSQLEMLKHHPDAVDHAIEAIAVARRVGDSFAEINAGINLFTEQATLGVAPDAGELLAIVAAAAEAGVYEEAYRAIVNFIWSAVGYLPIDRIEQVVLEARRRIGDVPPPESIATYLEMSVASMLLIPAARWAEAEEIVDRLEENALPATARIVWLSVVAGLAFRRGEMEKAGQLLEPFRSLALSSGEPQRIVPMACVVLPWLALADEKDELRSLTEQLVAALDERWPAVLTTVPLVRALATIGEADLLSRVSHSMRSTPNVSAKVESSLLAADGLLALLQGRASDAVEQLTAAVETERAMGYTFDAACLDLDLAEALEAAGDAPAAEQARARSASVLEALGCVNPF